MNNKKSESAGGLSRRNFLTTAAVAGAGLVLGQVASAGEENNKIEPLNVAVIGVGSQGRNLINNCLKIENIRFNTLFDSSR